MAEKEMKCGTCETPHDPECFGIADPCEVVDCGGSIVEVIDTGDGLVQTVSGTKSADQLKAAEKKKRTRRTNPLRWARGLDEDLSPRKMVEAYPYLVGGPQLFGPEFQTPTLAYAWLGIPGNSAPGYIHQLVRINERDVEVKEIRQYELIRRGDDDKYVTIGSTTL